MAAVDPRIREFNQQAQAALAAVQRANAEARALGAQIEQDTAAQQRLAGRVGGRAGVAEEGAAGARVTQGAQTRVKTLTDEEAVQTRLNRVRAQGTASLDAQAAAYRNANQYGAYSGGRRTFNQFGYAGASGGGPPIIPPGGKLPPEGGFPQLPMRTGAPPPTQIGSSLDAEGQKLQAARVEADSYRLSVSKLAQEQNLASTAMHRHGALTTEFITAAQRGEVTLRELGYQVGSTIGKFGGWLVAGSAVYFAFDALTKLKAGAIDATSGIQQISRVVNNLNFKTASEEISGLAGKFNLPVNTVTETAFGIGKAYHNQAAALLATKSALYAVKIGEIDAGTATKYLIAIINGFHLPAAKMGVLFDELVTAQKHYAIDLPSLMGGVGRAAGSFRAAGGDVHTLIALITTLQHVSGQTGTVIGTAIQRSPHFIAQAKNQAILEQYGLNPREQITKLYNDAINAAQGQSGSAQRQIAEGLFGPQYGARVGIFLLQNKRLFNQVLKTTSPESAKGEAQRQLDIVLEKTSEKISKIGVSLERLGLGLAQGHLLDIFGLLIESINGALNLANALTSAFDQLPTGVQRTLAYALELGIVIRSLRRFQLGDSIAGGATAQPGGIRGALARTFDRGPLGEARLFRGGLYEEQKQLEESRGQFTSQIAKHGGLSDAANKAYLAASERAPLLATQAAGGSEKAVAAMQRNNEAIENYHGVMTRNAQIADELKVQSAYADERLKSVNESLARTKTRGFFSANKALEERERTTGVQFYPSTAERPSTAPAATGKGITAQAKGVAETSALLVPATAEREMQAAEQQVAVGTQRVGRLQTTAGALGGAANSLLNRVGTLFFGLSIGLLLNQVISSAVKGLEKDTVEIEKAAANAKDLKRIAKSKASGHGSITGTIGDYLTGAGGFSGPGGITPLDIIPTYAFAHHVLGFGGGPSNASLQREAEEAKIVAAKDTLALQAKQRKQGEPESFKFSAELQKRVRQVLRSSASQAQKLKELEKLEAENEKSAEATVAGNINPAKVKGVEEAIQGAKGSVGSVKDFTRILDRLEPKQLESWMTDYTKLIEGINGTFNVGAFGRASALYRHQLLSFGNSKNPDDLKKLAEAQEGFYQAISQAVNNEVTKGFLLAEGPGDRLKVASNALQNLKNSLINDPRKAIAEQQAKVQQAQQKYHGAAAGNQPYSSKYLKGLQTELGAEKSQLKLLEKDAKDRHKYYDQIEKELRQQIYSAVSAIRDAKSSYRSSQTADPLKQVSIELAKINADLAGAIKAYGRNSSQVFSLLQQREQALASRAQDELSTIQAQGTLAGAGFYSYQTVAKEKSALASLQRQLGFEQSHANRFSPTAIIEVEAQVKAAQIQLTEDIEKEAKDLKDAAFGIKEAKAKAGGHSVRAVQLEIQKAKYDLSQAKTPLEKLNAQEQLITLAAQKRDTVAKKRLETIEYEANLNKISTQQEIVQLEQLLKDYKLSQDMRRQIKEQIHGLKKNTGFDLDIGNITLPTAYDIRRAVQGGIQGNPSVNVTNAPNVIINNYSSDPNVVGHAVGQALGGSTQSAMRSAGVKG